ncbi:MAG: helix-turn-helix transcriptional regulator [Thermoleophilia bacterium]|nr:helix-turn-helix transcriptional regulator [Thermoleophilia bacterium]
MRYTSAQHRFGANLRAIREEKGLTQERLALDAGFHRAYVGSLERGNYNVTLGVVVHLARFLGVPATALVEGVEQGDDAPVFRTNKLNR